jgi:hypothetical protein
MECLEIIELVEHNSALQENQGVKNNVHRSTVKG